MQKYDYDVALSFAGEDRSLAQAIAEGLKAARITVFYDDFEKYRLWGKNLDTYLAEIYSIKARYCIPIISRQYRDKRWPKHEWMAMRSTAFGKDSEYILPIRLDDTELPGLFNTISYLKCPPETSDTIVSAVISKLGVPMPKLKTASFRVVIERWLAKKAGAVGAPPLYIISGGSVKYDPVRRSLFMKEYQSTDPVTGIVQLTRSLDRSNPDALTGAICDYEGLIRDGTNDQFDAVIIGAADTNRVAREFFAQDVGDLPVRFDAPINSDVIVAVAPQIVFSDPLNGILLALENPLPKIPFAIICAGNGAPGTNAALALLADLVERKEDPKGILDKSAVIVEADRASGRAAIKWAA